MSGRKKRQPKRQQPQRSSSPPQTIPLPETPHTAYVVLKIRSEMLNQFPPTPTTRSRNVEGEERDVDVYIAEGENLAHIPQDAANGSLPSMQDAATNDISAPKDAQAPPPRRAKQATKNGKSAAGRGRATTTGKSRLHSPAHHRGRNAKSILKPDTSSSAVRKRQHPGPAGRSQRKSVTLDPEPDIQHIDYPFYVLSDEENEPPQASSDSDPDRLSPSHRNDDNHDANDAMSDPTAKAQRPSLKLKLSKPVIPQAGGAQPVQTPVPASATRTPSIKLKFGGTPQATPENAPKPSKKVPDSPAVATPSSAKKRKRPSQANDGEEEPPRKAPKPPTIRKITLKQSAPPGPAQPAAPKSTQILSIKTKGKIPKRPLGVGYDSELDNEIEDDKGNKLPGRENDPVLHEGFILRMQPGEDCDFLRKAIQDGTLGLSFAKGGAAISLRMLDTQGRRGIMNIKKNQYATTLVDLPCIIEGMKSWDKKGWIKSIDICQMLLVLGRCSNDEEARNYPLPDDVDPNTYQFSHGLTAPMKWVRKRRFARTKRARVDDIEAVERRVHALIEADKAAVSSRHYVLDHDPRLDERAYSSELESEDEDAEAEDDIDDYFAIPRGQNGSFAETPVFTETPIQVDIGQDDVDEFARMFGDEDDVPATETPSQAQNTLHIPEVGDSSFAITSTSASPSITAAQTPASAPEASSDEDDDDDGGEDDEDLDDAEKEGDENLQQVKERIEDMQQKIAEQTDLLKKTQNAILKKKLARKIQDLKDDVAMMKKNAGLGGDEDDD